MIQNYIVIAITVIIIIIIYNNNNIEHFNHMLFNMPSRISRFYYDIRGIPNLLGTYDVFGRFYPLGFIYSSELYDTQGNLINNI